MAEEKIAVAQQTESSEKGEKKAPIRVACVGDSITEGFCSSDPDRRSYPAQLQLLLGDAYDVRNFGRGGTTLMVDSDWPYHEDVFYNQSHEFLPDIVIIMEGTNDTRDANFAKIYNFTADMVSFIKSYQELESKPTVYVATSPKMSNTSEMTERCCEINGYQREAAVLCGCTIIEIAEYSKGLTQYFPDGIHANDTGYVKLAQYFYEQIFGGVLYPCTVKTLAGATVEVGGQKVTADESGVAELLLPAGEMRIRIMLSGYISVVKTIFVSGKLEISAGMARGGDNLALGRPCSASNSEENNPAENAVDGKYNTRWASGVGDEYILTVELDGIHEISSALISWETAFAKGYSIEVSDDGSIWNEVYKTDCGAGGIEEIPLVGISAAFFRIRCTEKGTMYGYSIFEVEVYGKAPAYSEPEFSVSTLPGEGAEQIPQKTTKSAKKIRKPHFKFGKKICSESKIPVDSLLVGAAVAAAVAAIGIAAVSLIKKKK